MEEAAAPETAIQTRASEAQPAATALPQYQLTIIPLIKLNIMVATAVEPNTQLRALAEEAAKQKSKETLQSADSKAAMEAAAVAAASAGSVSASAAPAVVSAQPQPQQPQPAVETTCHFTLQLLLDVEGPSMNIALVQEPTRGDRDKAEAAAAAAGKHILNTLGSMADIIAAVHAALATPPITAAVPAIPVPQQLSNQAVQSPPLLASSSGDQGNQAMPSPPPAATAAMEFINATFADPTAAAAAFEDQEQTAATQSAAARAGRQLQAKRVVQLAASKKAHQVDKQQQSKRRSQSVSTRRTSLSAGDPQTPAAASSPANSKHHSGQDGQQHTLPAVAPEATAVRVANSNKQQSNIVEAHEVQQQQQQQQQQFQRSSSPGLSRSPGGAKRGRGKRDAAAAQPAVTQYKETRRSQAAAAAAANADDDDAVAPQKVQQVDLVSTGKQLMAAAVEQQQQLEPAAAQGEKVPAGRTRGREGRRTPAAPPAAQQAAEEPREPAEPADAVLAPTAVLDQDKTGGRSRKRARQSATAAEAASEQAANCDAAVGNRQELTAAAAAAGGSRQTRTRRPLAQTQPPTPDAAAGSDTAAAAASRSTKRRRNSQQEQLRQQAADKQDSTARGRSSRQPTALSNSSAAPQLASQRSAALVAVVATNQRATARTAEKEAAFQKEAAAAEYPPGWKPFPEHNKDKTQCTAAASAASREQKDKESEFAAAVAAADLPRLPPGPGQLRQDTQGCCYRRDLPDLSAYRLGDHTGHHAKLWRKSMRNGSVFWEQLSTSCHDCQHQHVRWVCSDPQHAWTAGKSSYCNRCLYTRYRHTSHSLSALHQSCPRCRGMCTCKSCLRQPEHAGRVATGGYTADDLRRFGGYVLRFVGPPLKQWLQLQQEESAAAGYDSLALVPVEKLHEQERMNCDRCGTNLVGLFVHCSEEDCQWDICHTCMRELRQQQQQQGGAAAAVETNGVFKWTCCNPACSSTVRAIRQQHTTQQQEKQQSRQQDQIQQQEHQPQAVESPQEAAADVPSDLLVEGPAATGAQAAVEGTLPSAGSRQRRKSKKLLDSEEVERLLHHMPADSEPPATTAAAGGDDDGTVEAGAAEAAAATAVMSQRCAAAGHGVHGDELQCVPGAAELQVKFMMPGDLLQEVDDDSSSSSVLEQLRQVAEAYGDFQPSQLKLSDCPYLSPGAPLIPAAAGPAANASVDISGVEVASSAAVGAACDFTLSDLLSDDWWKVLPDDLRDVWRRKASSSVFLFTPHATDLDWPVITGPTAAAAVGRVTLARLVFWARWLMRDPIIVRGLKGRIPWDPETMVRAMKNFDASEECVTVMDCADFHKIPGVKAATFFKGYVEGFWRKAGGGSRALSKDVADAEPAMLKVKDWPPADEFRKELPRHFMDFIERLPVRYYTDPRLGRGPLNLSTCLDKSDNPTDLGPKGYLAYGRWQESTSEGDSVTKMHLDMTDAVNLLVDVQPGGDAVARQRAAVAAEGGEGSAAAAAVSAALDGGQCVRCGESEPDKPGYGGAGAVWDIVRQSDVAAVSDFLSTHAHKFIHQGARVQPSPCSAAHKNPVMSQYFMLVDRHRQQLRDFLPDRHVEMLHFEQHLNEGVFIPAGCPHQVRNLQSCTKVAVDYVSPEALSDCLAQRLKLRELDLWCGEPAKVDEDGERIVPSDRDYAEKLQSQLIMVRAALTAAGLTAERQLMPRNIEPELPEVAADARVTRIAVQPPASGGRAQSSSAGAGTAPSLAATASGSAPDSGVQGEGAGVSSGRLGAGGRKRGSGSTVAAAGTSRGWSRAR